MARRWLILGLLLITLLLLGCTGEGGSSPAVSKALGGVQESNVSIQGSQNRSQVKTYECPDGTIVTSLSNCPHCPFTCDDDNPCTLDHCNATTNYTCKHEPLSGDEMGCGNFCEIKICLNGTCIKKNLVVCAEKCVDGVRYYGGVCGPSTGRCNYSTEICQLGCGVNNKCTTCKTSGICFEESECCSSYYCSPLGYCAKIPSCIFEYGSCNVTNDCCSGLVCANGICSKSKECKFFGQCDSDADCCTGYFCDGVSCRPSSRDIWLCCYAKWEEQKGCYLSCPVATELLGVYSSLQDCQTNCEG